MRKIAASDSVHVLYSEHGFGMMGGAAYAEVLRTLKDVVEERTGCTNLRLAFSSGLSKIEGQEIMPQHSLADHHRTEAVAIARRLGVTRG
jgi:hypothetical protein